MRLNWSKTFVLGFGFLAISAVWPLYDSYMPKFYAQYIVSSTIIGFLMGLDNFLGLTLQPWIGSLSDRTKTEWGRRRPFLLVGMPVAAVFVAGLPLAMQTSLAALIVAAVGMNLAMSLFRSPTVALMPDLTPAPLRSLANGVINLMGGIGAAVVLLLGSKLYAAHVAYPFIFSAGILIAVFFLFLTVIREPEKVQDPVDPDATPQSLLKALKQIVSSPDRNTMILFLAIFSWFVGYQSVSTWFTMYGEENLGVPIEAASGALFFFSVAFVVGALPSGWLGTKLGRRPVIITGLLVLIGCFVTMNFLTSIAEMRIALLVAGLGWALININSFPMVWELCHPSQTGTYTGLYYIFSGIAGTGGPALMGVLFDSMGSKQILFAAAAGAMTVSLLLILLVRKGEALTGKQMAA